MIYNLPDTTTGEIAAKLVQIRESGGQVTTGRVLTLIVQATPEDDIESIISATNDASREHPSRVLLVVAGDPDADSRVDAAIRIGGDAGASEVIEIRLRGEVAGHVESVVTPLLLPDTPIVAWWPSSTAPEDTAQDPIGKIAQRRITDALFDPTPDILANRREHYSPGDSDLAWSRITPWRGIMASALDLSPHEEIREVTLEGAALSPSVDLAAGWLAGRLGCPVHRGCNGQDAEEFLEDGTLGVAVTHCHLVREHTDIDVVLHDAGTLKVTIDGQEARLAAISRRTLADCLAEELRHLDPDRAYEAVLEGLKLVPEVPTHA